MGLVDPCSLLSKPRGLCTPSFSPLNYNPALWLDPSYGIYTDRSTQLTAASSQYWKRTAASAGAFEFGDVDFWGGVWIKHDSFTGGDLEGLNIGKFGSPNGWLVYQYQNNTYFQINATYCSNAYSTTGSWSFLFWYHDAINNQIGISRNGGAFTTTSVSGGPTAAPATDFLVGQYAGSHFHDGPLDSLMIGASPVGGIAALATTIRDYLYNSGSGRVSADVTAAQKTAWGGVSAYDYDGDGLDAWGTNDLTAVNSPTYTTGIASGTAGDGDVESLVVPRVGGNGTPPSYAARPIWTAGGGKPYHLFDGSNDSISFGDLEAFDVGAGNFTLMFAAKGGDANDVLISKDDWAGASNGFLIYRGMADVRYWNGVTDTGFGVDSGAACIYTVVRSGTGAGQTALRRNGVEITTITDARTLSNAKALVFGDSADAGHTLNGRLGDVVFYSSALNSGQLAQLEAWAAARQAA